eukprot:2225320-Amphidinium_carterae.2
MTVMVVLAIVHDRIHKCNIVAVLGIHSVHLCHVLNFLIGSMLGVNKQGYAKRVEIKPSFGMDDHLQQKI